MIGQRFRHAGLTLLELMVVLIILAIVATVAIRSLEPQVNAQRLQAASRLLDEIRVAALGETQKFQLDGTPLVSGLLADVGCIPVSTQASTSNATESTVIASLPELWDPNCELAINYPFQFRSGPTRPRDYSEVRIPCGWRGPYLQLPAGVQRLLDPWGVSPKIVADADGQVGQVQIEIPEQAGNVQEMISVDLSSGKVNVTGTVLLDEASAASVEAVLLLPDPQTSLTTLAVRADEDQVDSTFSFTRVPIGFRAVAVNVGNRQQIKYVQVTHQGANVVFDFRSSTIDR